MSWLGGWLREIILIVLLATFVELLLPSKSMERYARLVLSLLILLTLLSPIVSLLKGNAASELSLAFSRADGGTSGQSGAADAELQKILADGRKLAAGGRDQSLKLAAQQIAAQMREQIAAETGKRGANVNVTLALTNEADSTWAPAITQVVVTLPGEAGAAQGNAPRRSGSGGSTQVTVEPVEDIKVELGEGENRLKEQGASAGRAADPAAAGTHEGSGPGGADAKAVTALLEKNWSLDPGKIKVVDGSADKL
ncbi:stage III sporulation protein AF [Paenibacillus sophorae]|uniref:Stage III sporulation protein AF n=1 Tax=Paenibacillus sophorae TaxID=1333845 RepID=A0A1H8N5A8_9BACL|nr:stage III sporulation protein AF [Paenibacillus sophorae]QWU14778.1 stage III sporulation protein AF [Paenibacillus sophorae]SEO24689.1 stage III sporulation protein AF [Paenibacillus sophorae]